MMVAKLYFLFYLSYPSLSLTWCSSWGIERRSAAFSKVPVELSKSNLIADHRVLLFHNNPFENCRRNSQQLKSRSNDLVQLWSVNGGACNQDDNDAVAAVHVVDNTKTALESDEVQPSASMAKAKRTLQKYFSSASPVNDKSAANILQFVLFITVACLMRLPSIASCTASACRIFPHQNMFGYEPMSVINWIIHYSAVVINYGNFHRLVRSRSPSPASVRNAGTTSRTSSNLTVSPSLLNRQRKIYAIVNCGLGQLFGMILMISHSLIGTRESMAQQALHNFSYFWMQASVMSLGPMLLCPLSLSCGVSFLVFYFNLTGFLSFTNMPGIVLSTFSLFSVLVTPTAIFPRMFKIGHAMLSVGFILVSEILDRKWGGGTDLAHSLGAVWLAVCMIIVRWSLDNAKDNAVRTSEEKMGMLQQSV